MDTLPPMRRAREPFGMVLGKNGDPPLYVGGSTFMMDVDQFVDIKLRCIVSCLPWAPEGIQDVLHELGVHESDYRVYHLEDSRDNFVSLFQYPDVVSVIDFIHSRRLQQKPVLVHCDGGITRSPTVCVAYIMKYGVDLLDRKPVSFAVASQHVRAARARMDLVLFTKELLAFEAEFNKVEREGSLRPHTNLAWSAPPCLSRYATARLQHDFHSALRKFGGHRGLTDEFSKHWSTPKRYEVRAEIARKALEVEVVVLLGHTLMNGLSQLHELCALVTDHPFTSSLEIPKHYENLHRALIKTFCDLNSENQMHWEQFVFVMQNHQTESISRRSREGSQTSLVNTLSMVISPRAALSPRALPASVEGSFVDNDEAPPIKTPPLKPMEFVLKKKRQLSLPGLSADDDIFEDPAALKIALARKETATPPT